MIKADRRPWALFMFDIYLSRLIRNNFSRFYTTNDFPEIPENKGLIVTPNHFSWWDGFFSYYVLKKHCGRNVYLMMLEEQLSQYWFFRKVGAYSVQPDNAVSIARSLAYTCELVSNPENLAIVFPQGEIEPYDKRPPDIKKGISYIAQDLHPDTIILPLACKIQYDNLKKPFIAVRFGSTQTARQVHRSFSLFENAFSTMLDELDTATKENTFLHNLLTQS